MEDKLHNIELVVLVTALHDLAQLYGGATDQICRYLANRYVDAEGQLFTLDDYQEAMICYALLCYGSYHRDKFSELAVCAISRKLDIQDKLLDLGKDLLAMHRLQKQVSDN